MTTTVLLALIKKLEGKVDSLETISFESVTELPETGEPNIIYLVPKSDPETGNYSDEYIWDSDNQTYEKIGDTQVSGLPEVTSADNGKILGVENGEWGKIENLGKIEIFDVGISTNSISLYNKKKVLDIINADRNGKTCILRGNYNSKRQQFYLPLDIRDDSVSFFNMQYNSDNSAMILIAIYASTSKNSTTLNRKTSFTNFGVLTPLVANKLLKVNSSATMFEMADPTPNANPNIASAYDATATYDLGDLVIYNGTLYECTTAITVAEAWTAAHWTAKTVADELANKADVSDIPADYAKDTAVTALYDSTATYELGDIVMYNKELYECTTAIPVAEAWDSTHWTKTDIFSQMPTPGGASYVELGGKLLAGDNTLTFNNECITVGSIFEFYTDTYGVNPTDVSVTDGTLVLTFDAQQNNLKVKVRVWEDENPITVIKSVDILTSDTGPVSAAVKFTYKEDNVEISEQTILYSQTDPPINIGDLILVDYGITYAGHWTIKAVRSCVYNGTVYAVGEIIRHWEFTEEVDFTVVENI